MALLVKGGGGKPEEEKTVTAGTSAVTVNPTTGKTLKKVTVNPTPTESKTVTPTTSVLTVTPSTGKHLASVKVNAVEDVTPEVNAQTPVITNILESLVGKVQGANATADKILEGYSAYVGQKLINGTYAEIIKNLGYTKISAGFVLPEKGGQLTIGHDLGVKPKMLIVANTEVKSISAIGYVLYQTGQCGYQGNTEHAYATSIPLSSSYSYYLGNITENSDNVFKIDFANQIHFSATQHRWIAMA